MYRLLPLALALAAAVALVPAGRGEEASTKGLRVATCGHSFHIFVPGILADLAKGAGVKGHQIAGLSAIGGSRVIQHWDRADSKVKPVLEAGEADVLTLSPIHLPDAGIDKFVELAVKHNKDVRVTLQANWLPYDSYDKKATLRGRPVDHDAPTAADLKKLHEPYFKEIDECVRQLNKTHKRDVVFVAPIGQAVNALREKIIDGKAPGLKKQSDLFTDAIGHAKAPLAALSGYCYYAVIYRRTPVGLPMPAVLKKAHDDEKLNRLLQEIAWETVTAHPLSGVKGSNKEK